MEGYRYAYLAGDAFFLALWLVLYYFMTCSRKAMLWSSVTLMWVSPLFEWLNQDYWKPEFFLPIKIGSFVLGVESLILGFSVIGISAGIFDWRHRRGDGASEVTRVTASSYWRLVVAGLLAAIPIVALTFLAGINSVHAHIYVCAVLAVGVIWRIKWQWKLPSLVTGLFMSGTMAAFWRSAWAAASTGWIRVRRSSTGKPADWISRRSSTSPLSRVISRPAASSSRITVWQRRSTTS